MLRGLVVILDVRGCGSRVWSEPVCLSWFKIACPRRQPGNYRCLPAMMETIYAHLLLSQKFHLLFSYFGELQNIKIRWEISGICWWWVNPNWSWYMSCTPSLWIDALIYYHMFFNSSDSWLKDILCSSACNTLWQYTIFIDSKSGWTCAFCLSSKFS